MLVGNNRYIMEATLEVQNKPSITIVLLLLYALHILHGISDCGGVGVWRYRVPTYTELLARLPLFNQHHICSYIDIRNFLYNSCRQPITYLLCYSYPLCGCDRGRLYDVLIVTVDLGIEVPAFNAANVALSSGKSMFNGQQILTALCMQFMWYNNKV